MNVIITAGGTSESIDSVRKITNTSSGKLGSIVANKLMESEKVDNVFYVCHLGAILPNQNKKLQIIYITNVESLQNTLKNLIKFQKIDAIVHSMAVSDYKVEYVSTSEILTEALANKSKNEIKTILEKNNFGIENKDKISSHLDNLFVKLVPTPKVISKIKEWDKDIFLIGFKLLSNVSDKKLIDVATELMQKNNCDAVVANDLKNISATTHKAFVLTKCGDKTTVKTKNEIAKQIADLINNIKKS